jgi:hypothetical protein
MSIKPTITTDGSIFKATDFATFGKPFTNNNPETDPGQCCLPGSFLNCPMVADLNACPKYMADKCASKWDNTCDLYVNNIETENKFQNFIRNVADKKFCRLADGSSCKKVCQSFNPITNDNSHQYCEYWGNEVLKNTRDSIDVGLNNTINISPDYMGKCQKTCDLLKPDEITNNDYIVNTCLKFGFCNDILSSVCNTLTVPSENSALNGYCKKFKAVANVNNNEKVEPSTSEKEKDDKNIIEKVINGVVNGDIYIIGIIIIIIFVIFLLTSKKKE